MITSTNKFLTFDVRLPPNIQPGIAIETDEVTGKKKKKRTKKKPIDSSLILKNNSDEKFKGALESGVKDPTEMINLEPGVNLEMDGRFISGPEVDHQNRMTLEEYYIYSQNNENDRVRYDKTGTHSQSQISQIQEDGDNSESLSNVFNPKEGNLLDIPQKGKSGSGFRPRPKTAKKLTARITGDLNKVRLLQDEPVDKKVNFETTRKNSSIYSNRPGSSKRSFMNHRSIHNSNLSRISKVNPALKAINQKRGVRPQTAKNYYTANINKIRQKSLRKNTVFQKRKNPNIKTAVIQYNEMQEKGKKILVQIQKFLYRH